jgi:hypothetical protein
MGTTLKYLRRTAAGAAGNGLGNTIKYLRGAAGIGLSTMAKYLRRTARQRPGHHDQVPATHNERFRGWRPQPMPGTTDVLIHHKRTAFAWLKKIARGQHDLTILHVLELQATAHVKGDQDAHRDVRVLPSLSNTHSSSSSRAPCLRVSTLKARPALHWRLVPLHHAQEADKVQALKENMYELT